MPPTPIVSEWHICLSGFMQRAGDVNGVVLIWDELRSIAPYAAEVQMHGWDANLADIAELIDRLAPSDAKPLVNIYGYSWGGYSAVLLARELQRRGVNVQRMVLCDAVYRHWYRLGWWRAFAPWARIVVPDNVLRVTHFRQRKSRPFGHVVKAANPGKTKMDPVALLPFDHMFMCRAPQFRAACIDAAKGIVDESISHNAAGLTVFNPWSWP